MRMTAADFKNMVKRVKPKQTAEEAGKTWPMPPDQKARVRPGNKWGAREIRGPVKVIVTLEDVEE